MRRLSAGVFIAMTMAAVLTATTSAAQSGSPTAAQALDAARQAIVALPASGVSPSTARRLADIKHEFADLAAAYAAQTQPDGGAGLNPPGGESWRLRLGILSSDLRTTDDVEPSIKANLNQLSARLDAFYAAAIGVDSGVPAVPSASPASPAGAAGAAAATASPLVLLDRIQKLVDGLLGPGPGLAGDGTSASAVAVNRATLNEIQSDLVQLRTTLMGTANR